MKISFEEIGTWTATFACSGVREGAVVKISGSAQVGACSAGDAFCGVAAAVSRTQDACSVTLGGLVSVNYSGDSAPSAGLTKLSADGKGGVQVDEENGSAYWVAAVDTAAKTATIRL